MANAEKYAALRLPQSPKAAMDKRPAVLTHAATMLAITPGDIPAPSNNRATPYCRLRRAAAPQDAGRDHE